MKPAQPKFRKLMQTIVLLIATCSLVGVQASTVLQMSFAEVVETSELVFEGTVSAVQPRRIADGSIHTFVTFQIAEIVKGSFSGDSIELRFLGGQVGTRGLQVGDLRMPELGETGIYFVESLQRFQINPLVGWAQGHYLIQTLGNGDTVVTTVEREPIASVAATSNAAMAAPESSFSKGLAKGVVVRRGLASNATYGVSAAQFKGSVRDIVEQAP